MAIAARKLRFWRLGNARRASQLGFLALFVALLFLTSRSISSPIPVWLFFALDPLLVLGTAIASGRVLLWLVPFALVTLLATALLGRFFCGWVCPMGTCIDLADRALGRKDPKDGPSPWRWTKVAVLVFVLVSAFFGPQLLYLLDPISLVTRTFIWAVMPGALYGGQVLSGQGWVYDVAPWLTQSPLLPDGHPAMRMGVLSAALFLGVLALGWIKPRFWCRFICPLGAMLGLTGLFGLWRRKVDAGACSECRKCTRKCKMGAIPDTYVDTLASECILCANCTEVCKSAGTSLPLRLSSDGIERKVDVGRRRVVGGVAAGVAWTMLGSSEWAAKQAESGGVRLSSSLLIRPPGSREETDFLERCVRCGICMKACPTGGLQPAVDEAGVAGLWTPVLVPRIGYCSPECTACGDLCPTEAIQPFHRDEKDHLYIGQASIDQSTCLVWAQDRTCLVCDEMCHYKAIRWTERDGKLLPLVDMGICVGCGNCENKCPVQPHAAIRVASTGDKRTMTREQQRDLRAQSPTHHRRMRHRRGQNEQPSIDPYGLNTP